MNELIATSHDSNGDIVVSGRDLHEYLAVSTQYTKWFDRMSEYGFVENVDFITVSQKRLTAQGNYTTYTDHHLKLDMAKEISMLQRSKRGKEARQYFLKLEKMWNSPEMVMKRALQYADKKVAELQEKIEQDKHKVFFAEAIQVSETAVLVKDLATILKQNGVSIGQNRLFVWLRENGYLCRSKAMHNKPTQKAMELGLFEVSTNVYTDSEGKVHTKYTPKVTGKGQVYFVDKFLNMKKEA
ncbi:oxidoreductase [Shouchella clausii]|uniref:phage antirepressor KilAC domain-containing protein n=1 Tax=Shouchella clausii TaxID=79880 RepID=UPI000BA58E69|nr:phage antirepressor KilAC domain-containing protein [Shouchella clausii]PAF08696.1 oxidoreductase [Shouchella clausii]GIN13162.1 phage antirepressor KilAC domain-containing protein [Shouchella clausii]